jgi:hypothetical protein
VISHYSRLFHSQKGIDHSHEDYGQFQAKQDADKHIQLLHELNASLEKDAFSASPSVLNMLADVTNVDPPRDFFLMRVLKLSLETYHAKQYDLSLLVRDLIQPIEHLREIERLKVRDDACSIPTSVIMCDECEKRSCVLKCEQCQDHFCQECFDELHATGNRRSHMTLEIEQLVCIACDCVVADCQCVQCGTFFCSPCFSAIHQSRSDLLKHRKRNISGLVCQECEHSHATVICEDCLDLFCSPCFLKFHRKGQREKHAHLTVDPNGQVFRGGLPIPLSEAQSVISAAKSSQSYSPWLAFKDPEGRPYWHNFESGKESNESPQT